eukprot:jgi/Ulvmu1/2937/UM149_0016.1
MPSESLKLITGRQDHLGSCTILQICDSIQGSKITAEYLFGLGENMPRAMLEHKRRPGRCLRATFAPTLDCHSIGGLGSLIMRLRDDGHEKVTCLGPNGIAAQILALQDLLRWPHPKVTVLEIPDLDDGSPAYDDDLIQVWAVGKPAVPWHTPCVTHMSDSTVHTGPLDPSPGAQTIADKDVSETSSSSPSEASKSEGSAHGGAPAVETHGDYPSGPSGAQDTDGLEADDSESQSGDSSDDPPDSGTGCDQQLHVFDRLDHVLAGRGSAAEVFAAMKARKLQNTASLSAHGRLSAASGGAHKPQLQKLSKSTPSDASVLHAAKRPRQNARDTVAWNAVKERKSNVTIARNAAGSIGKYADGAAAFVVFAKRSGRWLFLNFASEAQQFRQLSAHPMTRHLRSIARKEMETSTQDVPATASGNEQRGKRPMPAKPVSVSCIHLKPPGRRGTNSFHKLIDQLAGLQHFVAADGMFLLARIIVT